ncbi:MAG: site-specific integrase [Prevotella sp.]|nr:site-specific integrase [Prevotella sp.]
MKETVKLVKRKLPSGNITLNLAYTLNGQRVMESLGLYLYPETTSVNKKRNKATMEAATMLQSKKIVEIQSGKAGIIKPSKIVFTEYFQSFIEHRTKGNYKKVMGSTLRMWKEANGDKLKLGDVSRKHMVAFSEYAQAHVASSSASEYYGKVATVLAKAVRDELIPSNPAKMLDQGEKPKNRSSERKFLTIEEIKALIDTPCKNEMFKKAFLFSCFTGLRYSDIRTVRWEQICDGYIRKIMIKPGRLVSVPLSSNAISFLPEKKGDLVFNLKSDMQNKRYMDAWLKDAGITKHITFHCARHTFACLLITYDTDIYTTSKLLGHANVATTAIYAHLLDSKKESAVNRIPEVK